MQIPSWIRRRFRSFARNSLASATAPLMAELDVLQEKVANLQNAVETANDNLHGTYKKLLQHQIECFWRFIDERDFYSIVEQYVICPLCAYEGANTDFRTLDSDCIFSGGKLLRHQCPKCDLVFGPQKMLNLSKKALAADYGWHYQVFSEGDSTDQEVRAFHALQPSRDGVYLNWGAGSWSKTIPFLRSEGWNVFGYEPHQPPGGGGQYLINSESQLARMTFDGIFSNNVLEHLRDPVTELSAMRNLLKIDGKMSHATPCFEYLYEFTRFHLFFFLGRSRLLLAEMADLNIEEYIVDGEFMDLVLSRKIV